MERKLPGAAHAVRVILPMSLTKSGRARLHILRFAPLSALRLRLRLVPADRNANVVISVGVKQRDFPHREENVQHADILILKNEVSVKYTNCWAKKSAVQAQEESK